MGKGHLKKALKSAIEAEFVLSECEGQDGVYGTMGVQCLPSRGLTSAAGQLDTWGGAKVISPTCPSVLSLWAHSLALAAEMFFNLGGDEQADSFAAKAKDLAKQAKDKKAEERADRVFDALKGDKQAAAAPDQMQMMLMMQQQMAASGGGGESEKKGLDPDWVAATVSSCVKATVLVEDEDIHLDSPLMEMGMDSLSSVGFRNALNSAVGMNLPAALMFDYPSQRAIVDHIIEQSKM